MTSQTISATTMAVLNNISMAYGGESNAVFTSSQANFAIGGDPQSMHVLGGAETPGFLVPAPLEITTSTITTTGSTIGGTYNVPVIGDYFPSNPVQPLIAPWPNEWTSGGLGGLQTPWQFPIKPALELLEEGTHDIPGGKIIIKKIMVTEEQLDNAIQETIGHEASPEEKQAILQEIEAINAAEEREV